MKKKTHEDYVAELKIKNPNVKVIGKYVNANTKITHRCLIHDICWETIPSRALHGVGCKICKKEKDRVKRCKSHEKYIEELKTVNPKIITLEKYVDAKTKIMFKCLEHNVKWVTYPDSLLRGCGCYKCGIEKSVNKKRKSSEKYIEELKTVNKNIIVIESYKGANTPILHKCLKDGYKWNARPGNILFGKGCPKCASNIKKSHDEYIKELASVNPNIDVIEEYINTWEPILHKCKIHNITWRTSPSSILQGSGCTECCKEKQIIKLRKSHKQYIKEVAEINSNIIVIDNYINAYTQILHKCLVDGYEWYATPGHILSGTGCPKCGGHIQKTHDEYVYEVSMVNPDIEIVGKYINSNTKILHRCLKCGNEWYAMPFAILRGCGCPQCHESSGERQIRQWLEKNKIVYEFQKRYDDCRDIKTLPFDFYLPSYNYIIEYDDKQHFEPIEHFGGIDAFKLRVKHDNIKNEYCKKNGIKLLRIPYFKNIEEELNNFLFI